MRVLCMCYTARFAGSLQGSGTNFSPSLQTLAAELLGYLILLQIAVVQDRIQGTMFSVIFKQLRHHC